MTQGILSVPYIMKIDRLGSLLAYMGSTWCTQTNYQGKISLSIKGHGKGFVCSIGALKIILKRRYIDLCGKLEISLIKKDWHIL